VHVLIAALWVAHCDDLLPRRTCSAPNEVVFRAEVRVGLEILSTKTLRIADLSA
jgi:hypothetical protein